MLQGQSDLPDIILGLLIDRDNFAEFCLLQDNEEQLRSGQTKGQGVSLSSSNPQSKVESGEPGSILVFEQTPCLIKGFFRSVAQKRQNERGRGKMRQRDDLNKKLPENKKRQPRPSLERCFLARHVLK